MNKSERIRPACVPKKAAVSNIRKRYICRLVGRCIIFAVCLFVCVLRPDELNILYGLNFFKTLSSFHLLWVIWVMDMIFQLFPIGKMVPLGSQKLFRNRFKPIREKINYNALRKYVVSTTKAAYKVMLLWILMLAVLGTLYHLNIINATILFLISVAFYVCDLICVLVWCPFRLMMKTRCCTTCRIFNWDHFMMFSPMMFIGGFFSFSLVLLSVTVLTVWELFIMIYPERFWEESNGALQCSACTDKLCTQYCRKLR